MKTKQTIRMSLVLATLISIGTTGCGSSDDTTPAGTSSAVDIVVERGKVYDANVTDSSTPAQVATQKQGKNVYTFASTPVYPVVVNGGWIDVNDDGSMDASDVKLDIEMKSYGTTVTPLTTVMASAAKKEDRDAMYQALADELNVAGVGTDTEVTIEDLLKVPSEAPRDVMVVANATFKEMKEKNTLTPNLANVMGQFTTIDSTLADGASSVDAEQDVITSLESQTLVEKVSTQDIFEYEQEQPDAVVPELAVSLLKNNITGIDQYNFIFSPNYTVVKSDGVNEWLFKWHVDGSKLIIDMFDGDREEYTFDSTTPTDNSSVSMVGFYGSDIGTSPSVSTIIVTAPVVDTGTTTGGEDTVPTVTLDLATYSSIVIYKNIAETTASAMLSAFQNNAGFSSSSTTASASCADYGFTNPVATDVGGLSSKIYTEIGAAYTVRTCSEYDYANVAYSNGSTNIIAYYGN